MQERSQNTRRAIVRAAAELFSRDGYHVTTITQISKRAGVTTGALYFHFESKEAIAQFIVGEQHRLSTALASEILAANYSAVNTLTELSAALGARILEDPVVRAGMSLSTETLLLNEIYRQPWLDWIAIVGELLSRGMQEGDVRDDIDVMTFAQLIGPAFSGVRIASDVLHGYSDLLDRLRDLSLALIPAFAPDGRKEAILDDAAAIFERRMREGAEERGPALDESPADSGLRA